MPDSLARKEVKGELLRLRDKLDSRDPDERKSAARKVVSMMRQGESVAQLFSSVLRCVRTDDLQLKRLVYLYLVTYSSQQPEEAIMVVNTFIVDSADGNPIVRALAVRAMCRIKLDTVAEHMIVPLKRSLKDKDPYVRKTAAIAVSKLYDVIPEAVENAQLLHSLSDLIGDENPMVIANAAASLLEVNERRSVPVFAVDERTVSPIIGAMTQCSGWVQAILLDSLASYTPTSETDAAFLIDRLVPFLKHENPAVVVSSFRCIYKFMDTDSRPASEIFLLIVPPFITLVIRAEPEVQFVVLRTLNLFVIKYPKALARETRTFFCKYNEPSYVKLQKLDILVAICSPLNVQLILDELEEYCNSVDVRFVRKTIKTLGQIALKIAVAAQRVVSVLVKLMAGQAQYAVEESIVVVTDLLRKFPGEFESVIATVCANIEQLKEAAAKAAAVWIIGEYSDRIDNADVLLDPYLDVFLDEPPEVQPQILTAIVKNYTRHPKKSRDQLQFLLQEVSSKETSLPDTRDRAMIYWRLLSSVDLEAAKSAVIFSKTMVTNDVAQFDPAVLDELILNMGAVAGVLQVIPSDFVRRAKFLPEEVDEEPDSIAHAWRQVDSGNVDIFIDWSLRTFWLKVVNKSPNPINSFAIAFDQNCAGIGFLEQPQFPDALDFGDSFEVAIPVAYVERFYRPSDKNAIQVALRTSVDLKKFFVPIDAAAILLDTSGIGEAELKTAWSAFTSEFTVEIDGTLPSDDVFSGRSVHVVSRNGPVVTVAFTLPPANVYIAKVQQIRKQLAVVVHGNPALFEMIKGSAESIFASD
jgi:vesicle coat complex subunit